MSSIPAQGRIRIGSAPVSWGVWFAEDPRQVPWPRFLDEVARAGYEWIELGPYGYLPTDTARLSRELLGRGLHLCAGTVFTSLHHGPAAWDHAWEQVRPVAECARAVGARYLVDVPALWRDDKTGQIVEARQLTTEQWRNLTSGSEWLGRRVRDIYGLQLVVHPHADTHLDTPASVRRFLDDTDADSVGLCLDTGHYAYGGGDALDLIKTDGDRIGYLHLKQVDPVVLTEVIENDVPFGTAVQRGVMCEPPTGLPALEPVLTAARSLGSEVFAIVEQDMYPCTPTRPLPIAQRTLAVLRSFIE
ncbi:sugar phosphate isomerase/epimerase [Nocardia sp. CNY236]|uniref:sugar phosphate isomerase/epimerase family protein n=1 Tax=Nocardia sp. CNY236 TaxID=1169152 RepID=UPI0003FF4375|nr:sugar phosphate isomerase/epimerase [Nocardia sp. CNY236]